MKKKTYNQNAVIRGALRRAFARSPLVQEKMSESRREIPKFNKDGNRSKKDSVQRQCEVCLEWTGSTKISIDHINPVISVDGGFQDWNEFVERLWCDKHNLQRICDNCHNKKTQQERLARLNKKYSMELDGIEMSMFDIDPKNNKLLKELAKTISKYTSKQKTKGLEQIVQRAKELKNKLQKYK